MKFLFAEVMNSMSGMLRKSEQEKDREEIGNSQYKDDN
jgi:hypothetical protein